MTSSCNFACKLPVKAAAVAATVLAGLGPAAVSSAGPTPASASSATNGSAGTIPLLRIGTTFSQSTLDLAKNYASSTIDNLGLESLLQIGPQGQLEPDLATSWAQTSPVTYVYHLRQAVKFWDGDPLTAADVVYSLNYWRSPGSQVSYGYPTTVKSIAADGPDTVVVTLTRPDDSWAYDPAYGGTAGIFEMKFAIEHKATFGAPGVLIMGTGPWEVDGLDPTSGAQLSANPDWWGGKVPIQHISFRFFSSETSEALAMRAGEIDLVNNVSDPRSFEATSGAKMLSATSCWTGYFAFNVESAPWDDVHVRRAVAYALNRTDIVAANGGYAEPNYTFIPPMMLGTIASPAQVNGLLGSINLYPYSLAKAKAELAESAYPHGFSTTLLAYSYGNSLDIYQVIAADLGKIGIKAQVKVDTLPAWHVVEGGPPKQRSATFSQNGCDSPDPSWYTLELDSAGIQDGNDLANYASPTIDHLIAVGDAATSPGKRFAAYSGILRQLAVDVPYVPLYNQDIGLALSSKFAYPGYSQWTNVGDYVIGLKRAD